MRKQGKINALFLIETRKLLRTGPISVDEGSASVCLSTKDALPT